MLCCNISSFIPRTSRSRRTSSVLNKFTFNLSQGVFDKALTTNFVTWAFRLVEFQFVLNYLFLLMICIIIYRLIEDLFFEKHVVWIMTVINRK